MNYRWQVFEKNGLGSFGRIELCGHCLWRSVCFWPRQFGKSLRGTQVIYGAQAHLERSPYFLDQLVQWSEARKVLVILDETNFIMKPFQRRILRDQLEIFVDVMERLNPKRWGKTHTKWLYLCDLLLKAPTADLLDRVPTRRRTTRLVPHALDQLGDGITYRGITNDYEYACHGEPPPRPGSLQRAAPASREGTWSM